MDKKICKACNIEKPIKQFYKNNVFKDGYDSRCKICKSQNKKIYKGDGDWKKVKPYQQKWEDQFNIKAAHKEDFLLMYEFITKIGYDVNQDVHQQFCDKHNLKYKKRVKKIYNLFLPDGSRNPSVYENKKNKNI